VSVCVLLHAELADCEDEEDEKASGVRVTLARSHTLSHIHSLTHSLTNTNTNTNTDTDTNTNTLINTSTYTYNILSTLILSFVWN
jgi:hypothetical protein